MRRLVFCSDYSLLSNGHIRVGDAQDVIRDNILGPLEPPELMDGTTNNTREGGWAWL